MQSKSKLLVINYSMDVNDLLLSHQVEAVIGLARHFDRVEVITSRKGLLDLPKNIRVHNVAWDSNKSVRSLIRFLIISSKVLVVFRPRVVFSHMTDMQAAFIAPFLRTFHIRHVLWYAHKTKSKYLTIASKFVENIVTSTPGSCPLNSDKVVIIGQAINPQIFHSEIRFSGRLEKFVHIGRLDPAKRTDYIVESVSKLRSTNPRISLSLYGSIGNKKSGGWADQLVSFSARVENSEWLRIYPGVVRSDIPKIISSHDLFIHGYLGSLDKTLLEATFMKIPVLTENPEYLAIFGSWSKTTNPTIEQEFHGISSLSKEDIDKILEERFNLANREHSLNNWVSRLADVLVLNDAKKNSGDRPQ